MEWERPSALELEWEPPSTLELGWLSGAQNEAPEAIWEPFCQQSLRTAQNEPQ